MHRNIAEPADAIQDGPPSSACPPGASGDTHAAGPERPQQGAPPGSAQTSSAAASQQGACSSENGTEGLTEGLQADLCLDDAAMSAAARDVLQPIAVNNASGSLEHRRSGRQRRGRAGATASPAAAEHSHPSSRSLAAAVGTSRGSTVQQGQLQAASDCHPPYQNGTAAAVAALEMAMQQPTLQKLQAAIQQAVKCLGSADADEAAVIQVKCPCNGLLCTHLC